MEWISRRRDITWNTYGRNSVTQDKWRMSFLFSATSNVYQRVIYTKTNLFSRHTLDIVLKDLCENRKKCFFKAANSGGVGLAGDPDRQAQGLKQVVVEVWLAGILKVSDRQKWLT